MNSIEGDCTKGPPTVVIDACVWHASFLRDLLVHAAVTGTVSPIWTPTIEAEWTRSVVRRRPEISVQRVESVVARIRAVIPTGCIPTPSVGQIPKRLRTQLPDPCDLHVIAAAIASQTPLICTLDQRGFPAGELRSLGIEVVTPDHLTRKLLVERGPRMVDAMHRQRVSLRSPPADQAAYLGMLKRNTLAETARVLETLIEMRCCEL